MSAGIACRRALAAVAAVAVAAPVGLGATAGASPANQATAQTPLRINFDDADLDRGAPVLPNLGTADLDISVTSAAGGALTAANARVRPTVNKAIRTPAHDPSAGAARAVIKVVDDGGVDDLDPAADPFVFGADFALDAVNESHESGSLDNGNNLIQRGLFNNITQYKIQIDGTSVSCRIKGRSGVALVSSSMPIAAGRWYRVRCERSATQVTLSVTRWKKGKPVTAVTMANARTGRMTPAVPTVPLSVGGKLNADGALVTATDAFNGRIDNVVLRLP